jgi:hypothetical protein
MEALPHPIKKEIILRARKPLLNRSPYSPIFSRSPGLLFLQKCLAPTFYERKRKHMSVNREISSFSHILHFAQDTFQNPTLVPLSPWLPGYSPTFYGPNVEALP